MNMGSKVLYQGEEWEILFVYDNGYCEIKRWGTVQLVRSSEIESIEEK